MSEEATPQTTPEPAATEEPQPPRDSDQDFKDAIIADMKPEMQKALAQFKSQGVQPHVIPIAGEYFMYRTIKRSEWRELQREQAQRAKSSDENATQAMLQTMWEEALVFRCSLFPKIAQENYMSFDAGVISTMADAILFSSGFNQETIPLKL